MSKKHLKKKCEEVAEEEAAEEEAAEEQETASEDDSESKACPICPEMSSKEASTCAACGFAFI